MSDAGGMDEGVKPLGELFGRLIDDGRAYAKAEIELVKVKAEYKAERYRSAAILAGVALMLAFAAIVTLCLTLVLALASLLGPLGGGAAATLIVGGAAALSAALAKKAFERADD